MTSFEEPPYKKRKKEHLPPPSSSLLSRLPDDVAISCVARLSRTEQAALSLTCKSYRSLVASPELYKARSLMGRTETHVYVCLRTPLDPIPRWYILRRRKTIDLIPIPIPIPSLPPQSPEGSSVVALDWGIYVIGGLNKGNPTSDVLLLDCRTHTWRHVPSMGVARASPAAGVVDGKIYVLGGCKFDDYSLSWGEVFDPKTQTWDCLPPMPNRKKRHEYTQDCLVRDGKVYAVDITYRTFYYSPSESKWGKGNRGEMLGNTRDWCIVDNMLYSLSRHGRIYFCDKDDLDWQESEELMCWWNEVKGLEGLRLKLSRSRLVHFGEQTMELWNEVKLEYNDLQEELEYVLPGARMSNSGGNIVLFWDEIVQASVRIWNAQTRLQIWSAQISLEERQGEIWGNIDWSHPVMTVDHVRSRGRNKVLHNVSVSL